MRIQDLESKPDEELVRAFVDHNDRDSLEVLLRRHENRVYGLAYRTLGNHHDALDATQDVFAVLFRKARQFRGESSFATWLYRLTTNVCMDSVRKRARSPMPSDDEVASARSDIGEADDRMLVQQTLSSLPVDHRIVLALRDIYGLAYEEIAKILDIPVGTVKSRIARARAAFTTALGMGEEHSGTADRLSEKEK